MTADPFAVVEWRGGCIGWWLYCIKWDGDCISRALHAQKTAAARSSRKLLMRWPLRSGYCTRAQQRERQGQRQRERESARASERDRARNRETERQRDRDRDFLPPLPPSVCILLPGLGSTNETGVKERERERESIRNVCQKRR